jgi:hypothetical protein
MILYARLFSHPQSEADSSALTSPITLPWHFVLGLPLVWAWSLFWVGVICGTLAAQEAPFTGLSPTASSSGSTRYFPFSDIKTVIQKWSPNQHLYVQGNLGLSQSQLMGLESWIHKKGPHWTVILMEDARGQRYTNSDGRIETGMDAVELSMGDLVEVGSYRSQLNSVTGEQDAAVFILFLKQRKFSYRASEAQNRRGLGQNRWIGKLDRPAFRAMRGGGRILDAVRDTITAINQSLDRAISQEQKLAEQKRLFRQREIDHLLSRLAEIENKLSTIEVSAAKLLEQHPDASSDMTRPEVARIGDQIIEIRKSLSDDAAELNPLKEAADRAANQSDDWINLFREYDRYETSENQLLQRKEQLQADAGDLAVKLEPSFEKIRRMMDDARSAYEIADSKFQNHLNSATYAMENATQELKDLRIAQKQSAARKTFVQSALAAMAAVFTTLVAGLFFWANRKRAPAKARAVEKLKQRQQEVRQQMDGMGDLLKRADVVIGDREAIKRKGYQGKTRDLSNKALDDIGQIILISSSVDKAIDGAKEKIQPKSAWTKFVNGWSAQNFNDGFELLENEPIEFDENEGIALVRERDSVQSSDGESATSQASSTAGPQKISLSFSQLFEIFQQRSRSANETIGQVESGWTQIVSTNRDLQAAIDQASAEEQKARDASESDGLLQVPQLFDDLLKSAQSDQDQAEQIGRTDPISAIQGPATTGLRKAANADQLAKQLNEVRESIIPSIRANTQSLQHRGREIQWVDAALDDFTERAQTLSNDALSADAGVAIGHWRTSFENFEAAVAKAVQLHDRSVNEILPRIETETGHANIAKQTIAKRLGISAEEALAETHNDVLKMLHSASSHNAAALNELDRGDPVAAADSIDRADEWIEDAADVSTQSLAILDNLLPGVQNLETQIQSTVLRLKETETTLHQLQDSFTKSSLSIEGANWVADPFSSGGEDEELTDESSEIPSMPAADLFFMAKRQSEKASDAAKNARQWYTVGRLLGADVCHHHGQLQVDACDHNQKLIQDRAVQLQQIVEDNAGKLSLLWKQLESVELLSRQHFVTHQTRELLKAEEQNLIDLQRGFESESVRRDPFNESSAIESVNEDINSLQSAVGQDQRLFEEAKRSVESLDHAIEQSRSAVSRSQRDQIPDSRDVQRSITSLKQAESDRSVLQQRLQTPHEDWNAIDRAADELTSSVTQALASLQSELDAAQQAASEIQTASRRFQQALNWSGSFGVRATPAAARPMLDQARALLGQGDYQAASQHARQANQYAINSIAAAENEVMRQQAARRRAAEQRRRAARQRVTSNRSILGSGSSFPSRRSSSRHSQSSTGRGGFSRSGW